MKFTKRLLEAIEPSDKRQVLFDDEFTGFALRVSPNGRKTFYYSYRPGKGRGAEKKWVMIGSFPEWTVEQARQRCKEMASAVHQGVDPAAALQEEKAALTVSEAMDAFYQEYVEKLKPNTIAFYKHIIDHHLKPQLGKLRAKALGYADIAKLHTRLKGKPYMANRCIAVVSVFLNWCEKHGYRDRNTNPSKDIALYREHKRQEFMGATELSILGDTLDRMERTWLERQSTKEKRTGDLVDTITPQAAAAIRLLMFTGARRGEILALKWANIDLEQGVAVLPDSKTGFKVLQLPAPAMAVLNGLPQVSEYVFPSPSAAGHMVNIKDAWGDVLKQSGLTGWRLHDLRHAFASMMVNSGASLPIVGKILGHSNVSTTQRYAHLEQNPARKAAEDAAAKIAQALKAKPQKGKVVHFSKASGGAE